MFSAELPRVGHAPSQDHRSLREVSLADGLEVVGNYWFSCSLVEKVLIPASVRKIGRFSFYMCSKLGEVSF